MPQYTLAAPERQVVVSWLFEMKGYLDNAVREDGVSARQALGADPDLDVAQWIQEGTPLKQTPAGLSDWLECGMVWWIWKHSGENIPPPQKPPQAAEWVARLQEWDASIDAGWARQPQNERDTHTYPITAEDGSISQMPSGAHLAHQQTMITKVLGVLA